MRDCYGNPNKRWIKTRFVAALASLCALFLLVPVVNAETLTFEDSWGEAGFNLMDQSATGVEIVFSVPTMNLTDVLVGGEMMQAVNIPGVFYPMTRVLPIYRAPPGSSPFRKVLRSRLRSLITARNC